MTKLFETVTQVAPLFVMLALGYLFKRRRFLPREAVSSIKGFIASVSLPAVVLGAFSTVPINRVTGVTFVTIFLALAVALGSGLVLDRLMKRRSVRPFLMTAFEAGMLGLPLFSIFYGAAAVPRIAMADLGEICFTFLIIIPLLNQRNGGPSGIKPAILRLVRNPIIWAVTIGLASAATGLSGYLLTTMGGKVIFSTLGFVGAPTGVLILFVVGYDLDFSRKNLGAALPTVALRYLVMVPLFFAAQAIISALGYGPGAAASEDAHIVHAALLFLFLMPSTFAIPVFGKEGKESEYIATTLSLNTLVTVILLVIVTAV
jgi:predicted permease